MALCCDYLNYLIKEIRMLAQVRHIILMPDIITVFGDIFDPVHGSKRST